ncbi:MAG: hypothetical protein GC161_03730 [Planctomycetaceae bacterium]|nr:hypothetical protein [Planctomycetaceae bacterium]
MKPVALLFSIVLVLSTAPLAVHALQSDAPAEEAVAVAAPKDEVTAPVDEALDPLRSELMELAFRAASAMPNHPHIKNRSRAQEQVVDLALELGQSNRVIEYAERIDNWRRASAYAKYAEHAASLGHRALAESYVAKSRSNLEHHLANPTVYESVQPWMAERIRVVLAKAHYHMGNEDAGREIVQQLGDESNAAVRAIGIEHLTAEHFEGKLAEVRGEIGRGGIDPVRYGLETAVQLHRHFFADAEKRTLLEGIVRDSWRPVPLAVRIQFLTAMARSASDHGDQPHALALLDEARTQLDSVTWLVPDRLPLVALLAEGRHAAGDEEGAAKELREGLALFHTERERIPDVFRGEALRPLAEAHQRIGQGEVALAIYRLALDEGLLNPNSRPRAEDLVATACSMARTRAPADAALLARLRAAVEALGEPW